MVKERETQIKLAQQSKHKTFAFADIFEIK